jgi:very-short-patch-repair endonuclease
MTSLEQALYDAFKKRRLPFEMHKTMFGRFQPDFVFEDARLIVQADGAYWHSRPQSRKQDALFNQRAAEAGWTVWRFGDSEILHHADACARAVARFVRDHKSSSYQVHLAL